MISGSSFRVELWFVHINSEGCVYWNPSVSSNSYISWEKGVDVFDIPIKGRTRRGAYDYPDSFTLTLKVTVHRLQLKGTVRGFGGVPSGQSLVVKLTGDRGQNEQSISVAKEQNDYFVDMNMGGVEWKWGDLYHLSIDGSNSKGLYLLDANGAFNNTVDVVRPFTIIVVNKPTEPLNVIALSPVVVDRGTGDCNQDKCVQVGLIWAAPKGAAAATTGSNSITADGNSDFDAGIEGIPDR